MDYKNYDIEDFLSDHSFVKWVVDRDEEAGIFWEACRESDTSLMEKIDHARALILGIRKVEQHPSEEQVKNIWQKIDHEISDTSFEANHRAANRKILKIAASVSILLTMLAALFLQKDQSIIAPVVSVETEVPADEYVNYQNDSGKPVRLTLSDGSMITLESKSVLKYRNDYAGQTSREVFLEGEAFFDIAKNPQQPFLVYANEIVTKVLGTSFRVKAYGDEKDFVVSVKEGKVSVFSAKESPAKVNDIDANVNGVILTPNQQVVYLRKENFFNKSLIDKPEIVRIEAFQYNFKFDNTPVKKVFAVLQEAYGVEILFDEEVMKNCHITVPLGKEPLYEKLKIICRTIGASYELIDAKIVISSKGC